MAGPDTRTVLPAFVFNFANTSVWSGGPGGTYTNDSTKTIIYYTTPIVTVANSAFLISYTASPSTTVLSFDAPCSLDTYALSFSFVPALPGWISCMLSQTNYV